VYVWYEYLSWSASSCNVRFNGIFEPSCFGFRIQKNWATHKNLRSNRNGEWENNFFKNRKFGVELKNLWFFFACSSFLLVPLYFLSIVFNKLYKKVHWITISNLLKCSIPLNPSMNVEFYKDQLLLNQMTFADCFVSCLLVRASFRDLKFSSLIGSNLVCPKFRYMI
jgi:hypothetical protein